MSVLAVGERRHPERSLTRGQRDAGARRLPCAAGVCAVVVSPSSARRRQPSVGPFPSIFSGG